MKLADIELLPGRVDIPLPATERDGGNVAGGQPVGVQPAIGDGQLGFKPLRLDRCHRGGDARLTVSQPKRFVIERAIEFAYPWRDVEPKSPGDDDE